MDVLRDNKSQFCSTFAISPFFYFSKNLVAFMLIHRLHWMKIYIISTNFFNRKKLNCCRQEMNSVKFASLL